MVRITREIFINAAPRTVWMATAAVELWPRWTPTVTSARQISGAGLAVGSRFVIKQPMQVESEWAVTDLQDEASFSWECGGRLLKMRATHQIQPSGSGTLNQLQISVKGLGALLLGPLMAPFLAYALKIENKGLKRYCENVLN